MRQFKMKRNSGIALVMTLLLLLILVVVVGDLSYTTKIDVFIAQNSSNDAQLRYALISAVNYGVTQLKLDALKEKENKKNKYDALTENWNKPVWSEKKPKKVGDVKVYYKIIDENSKFNLLLLLEKNKKKKKEEKKKQFDNSKKDDENKKKDKEKKKVKSISPAEQFDLIAQALQGEKNIIKPAKLRESIVFWLKNKKGKPDKAKGPFPNKVPIFSVKELLMAKGIKPVIIFGLPGLESQFNGIGDYVTVWSDAKININTASREMFQSLSSKITKEISDRIVDYREQIGPDGEKQVFKKNSDIKKIGGFGDKKKKIYAEIENLITVKSSYFSIHATARSKRMQKKLTVVVYRQGTKIYKIYSDFQ